MLRIQLRTDGTPIESSTLTAAMFSELPIACFRGSTPWDLPS